MAAGIVVRVMRSLDIFMTPAVFFGAYVVDIIIGDPRGFSHPVVIIGKAVRFLEDKIRRTSLIGRKKGGVILWFAVVVPTFFITWGIVKGCLFINALLGAIITVLLASITLATRSLFDESKAVIDALNNGKIASCAVSFYPKANR